MPAASSRRSSAAGTARVSPGHRKQSCKRRGWPGQRMRIPPRPPPARPSDGPRTAPAGNRRRSAPGCQLRSRASSHRPFTRHVRRQHTPAQPPQIHRVQGPRERQTRAFELPSVRIVISIKSRRVAGNTYRIGGFGVALVGWAGGCRSSGSGRPWPAVDGLAERCRRCSFRGRARPRAAPAWSPGRTARRTGRHRGSRHMAGREQMQARPGSRASWDRSVAMPCRPGPVAPGGRQVDCGKRMVDEVPPRRPGLRLPVAGEQRPAVAGEFVFRFGRRRSASGWAPGEPLAGASVAVVGGNWRVPG